ncbi:MAG: M14 family metallopeptidase [Pyrinomonadaceae bacterium]
MIIHKVRLYQAFCTSRGLTGFFLLLLLSAFVLSSAASAQQIPTPKSVLGFNPTDDKTIADWKQITNYFAKLDSASDRVKVEEIGKTTLGKSQIVAYISSAENIRNLNSIKALNQQLTDPRKHSGDPAWKLGEQIGRGKTIVAISCSIHSTEIVASQMSMLLAYQLATASDENTKNILENTVLLLIPSANPDGIDIVADWYRKTLNTKYEGSSPPELYHHYAGHDNNRDWFMMNLAETRNITKLFWQEWFPQIVYDVHQQGQTAARLTIPPFFDPPNTRISPVVLRELGLLGYKIAADLARTGEQGIVTNATYDTWWHGGFRSAPYYHNSIGILSEAASAELMSPINITKEMLERQRPARGMKSPLERLTNNPEPWNGGKWGPGDIARIELQAAFSVLDLAARLRPRYLENSYKLAKDAIAEEKSDPEAFVVYAGQPNEENVARFLEILMWQGMEVYEAVTEFEASTDAAMREKFGEIPGRSFVVFVNQPQRNNVLSLFEKQVYPERINSEGEAEVPYDVAGWTLPLQMGIDYGAIWNFKENEHSTRGFKKISDINQARRLLNLKPNSRSFDNLPNPLKTNPKVAMYKGWANSMDEGWTRLVLDNHQIKFTSLMDADFRENKLDYDSIILPSISARSIVEGRNEKDYPKEYTGGITEKGVANLKAFVENGGNLICFDSSCDMVIKEFGLPVKNVLEGKSRKEFYSPGSIVKLDVDRRFSLAKGFGNEVAGYFVNSSAYDIENTDVVKSVVKYADRNVLLSGWVYGKEHIEGKTALAEAGFGKGKITLFAFQPQHRGQTFATFKFLFNALEK